MRWLAIVALICLTGCIFIEDVERKGFGEEDLVAPQPYNVLLIKKPVANSLFPFSYTYNISWQFSDLYEGYRGAVMVEIENTGRNKIFVYGFGIKIDGKEYAKDDGGKEVAPAAKEKFYFSFDCPPAGQHEYQLGVFFMVGKGNRWYDYGLKYVEGIRTFDVKEFEGGEYKLYRNYYKYFDKINGLVDTNNAILKEKVNEITQGYGGDYNTAKLCAIFSWIYENIEYVNDTEDIWNSPQYAIEYGGDCEEFAMLMAAMVTIAGGTARVYLTDNHAFAAVYIGKDASLLKYIDEYYNANFSYAFFKDEMGYWLVADPLASFYIGGLPVGGVATKANGKNYEWSIVTNKLYAIDVLKD